MVDAVDLMFLQCLSNLSIERFGRRQIVAERLFDHHPAPSAMCLSDKAGGTEPRDRHTEKAICDGEVEKIVAGCACCLVQLHQMLVKLAVGLRIVEVALHIAHAVGKPLPRALVNAVDRELALVADEFFHRLSEASAPFLRALGGAVDADELKAAGQLLSGCQVIKCRDHETLR